MSRACGVCRGQGRERLMPDDRRHLHELEPGESFQLPLTGRVSRLVVASGGRAEIEDPSPPREVQFETFEGREVAFERPSNGTRPCAPTAQVFPLQGVGA